MNKDEKILSLLELLTSEVKEIKLDLHSLKDGQVRLEKDLNEINLRVEAIESKVFTIVKDVKYLRSASREAFKDIDILDIRTESLIK